MQKTKMKKRCRDGVTCVVLCTLPSIYLVCVVFGTAIPTSFYIFGKCFSYLYSYIGVGSCPHLGGGLLIKNQVLTIEATPTHGWVYFSLHCSVC